MFKSNLWSKISSKISFVQKYECSKISCVQKYHVQKYECPKISCVQKNIMSVQKYLECSKMSWVFKDVLFSILQRDWHTSSDSVYWYTPHLCTLMHSYGVYWHLAKNSVQSGAKGRPSWT